MSNRGYFGIGIFEPKIEENIGTLWRSAFAMGATFVFTIGKKYKHQASDTTKSWKHIPLYHYPTLTEFCNVVPHKCQVIGIELDKKSTKISEFVHPERCIYLLGSERIGLSDEALLCCNDLVQLQGKYCLNVAVAGSIAMYDRINKQQQTTR